MLQVRRVALVHDYWVHVRGGEQIFLALTRLFPQADCYVLIQRRGAQVAAATPRLRSSVLRFIPFGGRYFRALLPLYLLAARHLDLRGYDLVISSSSGFCHGLRTDGVHVCYCHAPLRYITQEREATLARARTPLDRLVLARLLDRMRVWDVRAAQRVTQCIANSSAVRARIAAYYGRPSVVVHPFKDVERFQSVPAAEVGGFLLVVSQLLSYKRVDLAIEACARLGRRLTVGGEGPDRARLEKLAGPFATFVGRVSDAELASLYARCLAFLQCGEEDFGMAAVEAQACCRSVLATGKGGALETIVPGVTGAFFAEQSVEAA